MEKKEKIIRILRIIMPIVAITILIVIAPLDLVPALIAPLHDTVQEEVDQSIDQGLDGIIVYVDQAGKSPEFYAAGLKNKINHQPADPNALFKIGSISKLYIAVATTKLINNGDLSLESTISELLPELDGRIEYADEITLRMLLQHRSGIPNFTDSEEWDWFKSQTNQQKILNMILDKPADFKPDTRTRYSNTNYLLIGWILDNTLGYSHHQYIKEEIIEPLGLTNTYSLLSEVDYNKVVSGYWYGYQDDLKRIDHVIPGGSMIASAQDVAIFLRALNDGSLLNAQEQEIYSSVYEYEHTGWVPGYYSIARYYQDIDTVVIQFVNTTGGDTWGLAEVTGGKTTAISNIVYNRIVRILHK